MTKHMLPLSLWLRSWRTPYVILGIALLAVGVVLLGSTVSFMLAVSGVYDTPLIDAVPNSKILRVEDAEVVAAPARATPQSTAQAVEVSDNVIPALFTPQTPTRITIPTIGVDSPVIEVGR